MKHFYRLQVPGSPYSSQWKTWLIIWGKEFGCILNWPYFYEGLKTTPIGYLKYWFDQKNLKTYLKSLQL